MPEQCVPGSLFSAYAQEPGNEDIVYQITHNMVHIIHTVNTSGLYTYYVRGLQVDTGNGWGVCISLAEVSAKEL